ncbi:MAG: AAA family ATPase, partial [Candidatus Delongbacteria bacterium]|nr:AAA family ATPase [Candidatus Delongbacteria bacterium]
MYLDSLRIINFRKFKDLEVKFNKGLNLIVGENDSGKTAIIDAVKYVLQTQSYEYIRPSYEDFHLEESKKEEERSTKFRIECIFSDFEDYEAKSFLEWLGIDDDKKYYLKIWYEATRKDTKVFYDIKAGADDEGTSVSGEARDFLRTTYLKPLRDAERELTPKRGSRLSQILDSHDQFKNKDKHRLKWIMKLTNKAIEKYFTNYEGKDLLDDINKYLSNFTLQSNQLNSKFIVSENSLKSILEKLALKLFNHDISENNIQGLGSHNLLYISAELLLLKKLEYSGLKLAMIEEIEAHLHPQIQIRLIEAIQEIGEKNNIQFILTSHSPNLASKIKLKNLIVCKNGQTYPMGDELTELDIGDYYFLEKFLDSTKANLFFANAVILVEGVAENILIPT